MMSSNSSVSSVVTYKSNSSVSSRRSRWSRSQASQNPPPPPMRQRLLRFGRHLYHSQLRSIGRASSSSSSLAEHDVDPECDAITLERRKARISTRSIAELDDDDDDDDEHDDSGEDIFGSEEETESDDDHEETGIIPPPTVIRSTNVLASNFLFLLLLRSEMGDETMEIKRVSIDADNRRSVMSSIHQNEGSIILPSLEGTGEPDDELCEESKEKEMDETDKTKPQEGCNSSIPVPEAPNLPRAFSRPAATADGNPCADYACVPENVVTMASNVQRKGTKGTTPFNLIRRMASCTCQVDDGSISSRTAPSSLLPQEDGNENDDDDSSHQFVVTFQDPLVTETWIASTASMLSYEEKEELFYSPEDYEDFRFDALYGDYDDDGFLAEAYCGDCSDGFHAVMSRAACVETAEPPTTPTAPSLLARIARAPSPTLLVESDPGRQRRRGSSVMSEFFAAPASLETLPSLALEVEEGADFREVCRESNNKVTDKTRPNQATTVQGR